MHDNKKQIDPIRDEFSSYEEAAEFWDTHDTTDYPEAFQTVEMQTEFRQRRYEIELDGDVVVVLKQLAYKKGVPVSSLASELLRKQLVLAA